MNKIYTDQAGTTFTDEQINKWCEAYDRGDFPTGERTVGGIRYGLPPRGGGKIAGDAAAKAKEDEQGEG